MIIEMQTKRGKVVEMKGLLYYSRAVAVGVEVELMPYRGPKHAAASRFGQVPLVKRRLRPNSEASKETLGSERQ